VTDRDKRCVSPYEEALLKQYRERRFWRRFVAILAVGGAILLGVGIFAGDSEFAADIKAFGMLALFGALIYFVGVINHEGL
jgi:uncharacterized RDD family membrane protein YckC